MGKPEISIVTPSFNMLPFLKLCSASVCDQEVNLEHIVMDGGSTDGTFEWLKDNQNVISKSEKDNGMYNALNKAIDRAQGDIIGHLNCDEQYLPGVLKFVLEIFDENPQVDFIAADFLVIDKEGGLLAYRKSFQPRWPYFFSNYLYTTTCTLFYRHKIFTQCRFNETYKSIADVIFLYEVMKKGYKGMHVKKYFSVFIFSGTNLSLSPISNVEKKKFNDTLPKWYRILKPLFFALFFGERVLKNTYYEKSPLSYSIFTKESLSERKTFVKLNPSFRLEFKFKPAAITH
jgi:glycosyltransferase involved in cell wall biosynthesis